MKIESTKIEDCYLITPEVSEDFRGEFVETWHKEYYKAGILPQDIDWKTDAFSYSLHSVLKGLHGDWKTWKLVQTISGCIFLSVIDCRRGGKTYGEEVSLVLSTRTHRQILIPPGCANGHLCLSDMCIFHYKQSEFYDPKNQFTVDYKDETLDIDWPIKTGLILSKRDRSGSRFINIERKT